MFPPPKAEEGLSSQFQQIDRNNGYGYNNGYNGAAGNEESTDDKKKGKKENNGSKSEAVKSTGNEKQKNGKNGAA